jgi:arylsulfatase A-like enzyme
MQPRLAHPFRFTLVLFASLFGSQLLLSNNSLQKLAAAEKQRPNILFIFTDDHASHAMSCYGSKVNQTPNLDRIAREGMRFDNCFCTNSICGPSRAVILTGKHSHINGFKQNGNKFDGSQQTFPKLLRKQGYQTAIVGKWHLASDPTGFDYSEILVGQGPYYNPPMIRNGKRVKHEGYTTDIITDLALDFLQKQRDPDKPFMLMFQHKAPHRNWQPGPKYLHMYDDVTIPEPENLFDNYEGRGTAARQQDMTIAHTMTEFDLKLTPPKNLTPEQLKVWNAAYDPKNEAFRKANLKGKELVRWKYQRYMKDYLRCIASVDDNVGRMLDYLEESGLAKNTVVMYSSDQGFYLGDHGWFDKRFMYEESYRMPLLARWPGVIKPGSVNQDLVSNLDFAETFLNIAGAPIPSDMQGVSLVPLFKGEETAWRDSLYYHYYEFYNNRRSAHMVRRHNGVRTKRYKLIHFYNLGEWELYDLEKDPHEMHSVYNNPAYAPIVKELKAELKRLQKQYKVPDDTGSVEKDPPSLYLKPRNSGTPQKKRPAKKQKQ